MANLTDVPNELLQDIGERLAFEDRLALFSYFPALHDTYASKFFRAIR